MSAQVHRIDKCPHCAGVLIQRSHEQNSKLHALLHDISTQKQWAGHWLDVEDWKRLLVAAFERANNEAARIFPAVDGKGIDIIYRRTHRMSKQEMIDLISYVESWAIDHGIRLTDTPPLEAA